MSIRTKKRLFQVILIALFLLIGVVFVMPYIWMLLNSFKPKAEVMRNMTAWPKKFVPDHYITVLTKAPILNWFVNSVVSSVTGTVIVLFTSTIAGFVFAKYEFKGKNVLFLFILGTMMVPAQTTMIPSFLLIEGLGMYDNILSLIVPTLVGGFGIFLCRQFIMDIPDSLVEAAQIDGAGDFFIYRRVIVPLIGPAVSSLAIFTFLEKWNDYLHPLLYLSKPVNMTMPLSIQFFSNQHASDVGATMAAATLIMLPVTIVFLCFQRQFIEGIAITGMK